MRQKKLCAGQEYQAHSVGQEHHAPQDDKTLIDTSIRPH